MPGIYTGSDKVHMPSNKVYTPPEGGGDAGGGKQKHACWCCYALLALLLAMPALYFLEKLASGAFRFIGAELGDEDFNIVVSDEPQNTALC